VEEEMTTESIEKTRQPPVYCIIPARKNSRRLKNKNKLLFRGEPLILYSIVQARESRVFDKIIVSSDDEDILEIAYENGCLVHWRPKPLARDTAELKNVCRQIFYAIQARPGAFAVLLPTSPLRSKDDIQNAHKLLKDANFVVSVTKCTKPPQWALELGRKYLKPYWGAEYLKQSQDLKPLYMPNGSIFFAKMGAFLREFETGFYGSKCVPYIMERSVDIDTKEDFEWAEYLMTKLS